VEENSTTTKLVRSTLISLIMLNEFLMGWLFTVVTGTPKITGDSPAQIAESTLISVSGFDWFLFTMALEIIFSIYMLRSAFSKKFVGLVCLQSLALVFIPTAISEPVWFDLCAVVDSVILIRFLVLAYGYLSQKRANNEGTRSYFFSLLALYAAMTAGFVVLTVNGSTLLLLIPAIGEMILYFKTIIEQTNSQIGNSVTRKLAGFPAVKDDGKLQLP